MINILSCTFLLFVLLISASCERSSTPQAEPLKPEPKAITRTKEVKPKSRPAEPLPLVVRPPEELIPIDPLLLAYCEAPYQTTCSTPWPSVDPSGFVRPSHRGEINALRQMRTLIRENPDWSSDAIQDQLAREIFTEQRRDRTFQVFQGVRRKLLLYIEDLTPEVFTRAEANALIERVSSVELELPPPIAVYSDALDLITKNAVYYERTPSGKLRLRIGGAFLLNSTSWFNIAFTLAHELAHAIDPCELTQAGILPSAYNSLTQCFVEAGWVAPDRNHCNQFEQISEVFADWMATQISASALKGWTIEYSPSERAQAAINSTRDLCEQSLEGESLNLSYHQHPQMRIESLFFLNPQLSAQVGCPPIDPPIIYCSFR
jgi:hypothetical protein